MTDWTPPTHVVSGTEIDSAKHNAEVVDNLIHLHTAKVARLGRLTAMTIADDTWTATEWTYKQYDTMNAWDALNADRLYVDRAGFYRASAQFVFPGMTGPAAGIRAIRLERHTTGGPVVITQATAVGGLRSTSVSLAAIVEMNGTTDYFHLAVYQDSGATVTTAAFVNHHFDVEWIGA